MQMHGTLGRAGAAGRIEPKAGLVRRSFGNGDIARSRIHQGLQAMMAVLERKVAEQPEALRVQREAIHGEAARRRDEIRSAAAG